jgi:hypothetical protein
MFGYNEELRDWFVSRNNIRVVKSRVMWWKGQVAREDNVYRVSVDKLRKTRPAGRRGSGMEDNIKINRNEIGKEGV